MKIFIFIQLVTFVHSLMDDVTRENLETYFRVGEYLRTHRPLSTSRVQMDTLENSNNIGIGYDLLHGSPVCYTASCQADGFLHPVFKLNYVSNRPGGCTTKLIPDGVTMQCLPGSERTAETQVIDSLDRLKEVTEKGFEINLGGKYSLLAASYKYSKETRHMIDTITKENSEVLYTTLKISTAKLSMFELRMNLSDDFRFVIENLPCCDYNKLVEKYIYDHVFGNFGYSYVSTLVLGGIARQSLIIRSLNATTLVEKGVNKKHEADVKFHASFGVKPSSSQDNTTNAMFMSHVSSDSITVLGGDPSKGKIDDWAQTVKENPVIIKFNIKYIFDTLTQAAGRFPNDPYIGNKSKMIEQALENYIETPVFCYGENCSGHGNCQDTGYFQFGKCQCQNGWSGLDCSNKVAEKPKPLVPSGTLMCMGNPNSICVDRDEPSFCPPRWDGDWDKILQNSCNKPYTDDQASPAGTICGYKVGNLTVLCDKRNPHSDPCPKGYEAHRKGPGTFCYKSNSIQDDLPGTMCGMQVREHTDWKLESSFWSTISEVACDGYYPGRGGCPPGYALQIGSARTVVPCGFMDWGRCDRTYMYSFCSKK